MTTAQIQEIINLIVNEGISIIIIGLFLYQYILGMKDNKNAKDEEVIIKKLDEIIDLIKKVIDKK